MVNPTPLQKAARWLLQKAVGFPTWGLTDPWPGGSLAMGDGFGTDPLNLAVVYGCARVRGQTLGSLPFRVYREEADESRVRATDHWSYRLLHDRPNAHMTTMEFIGALELAYCLHGNGYAQIIKLGNRVVSLNPLRPDRVRMKFPPMAPSIFYEYTDYTGTIKRLEPEEVIHIKNFSLDGFTGISPLRRNVIEHAQEAQNYGRNFFRNSGRPSGVLSSDQPPPANEETEKRMKADWLEKFGGSSNAGGTAVLWKGLKFDPISAPPEDAQYIQTRQLSTAEIAGGLYGVPLNLLGQTDKSATYASAEEFERQFVTHCIAPQAKLYEQAFNKALFSADPDIFCQFDLDEMTRGDTDAQSKANASDVQNGIVMRSEIRRKRNLPFVAGSDDLTVQLNLTPLDQLTTIANAKLQASTIPPASPGQQQPVKEHVPNITVTTPLAKEQVLEVVTEVTRSIMLQQMKKRTIKLIKTADGTTTGAELLPALEE